ncbi:MAG: shikimate dehydrogenase [Gammaproteobacteria bacterium]|jgi:shikimate dehydrogenase|nr:shikimate dehydrogenase [Gammaproteobacteria bacterium]
MQQNSEQSISAKYAVIGNPIAHSKSPEIHQLFADQTGENISYEKILGEKYNFPYSANKFFDADGQGLNVTLPFKLEAFNFVDQLTDFAKHAGAVNTIIRQDNGDYLGTNTDGIGLLRDLKKTLRLQLRDKKILIIGAGGATQGIVEPLLNEKPAGLTIANRTLHKAETIAKHFKKMGDIQSCSLNQIPEQAYDLILHATSAALQNHELELPAVIIGTQTCCYDLLYSDTATPFMQWAKKHGATQIVDGFGMLLEQAAESFYLWRGKRPDTTMAQNYLRPKSLT